MAHIGGAQQFRRCLVLICHVGLRFVPQRWFSHSLSVGRGLQRHGPDGPCHPPSGSRGWAGCGASYGPEGWQAVWGKARQAWHWGLGGPVCGRGRTRQEAAPSHTVATVIVQFCLLEPCPAPPACEGRVDCFLLGGDRRRWVAGVSRPLPTYPHALYEAPGPQTQFNNKERVYSRAIAFSNRRCSVPLESMLPKHLCYVH